MDISQNNHSDTVNFLDNYLSPLFRQRIEEVFYEKINIRAGLTEVMKDPLFLSHPLKHIALLNDHGVMHIREVTQCLLILLEQLNGIHFVKRSPARLAFMKGYGAMLSYIQDIGMMEVKLLDRHQDMHCQTAVQMLYNDFFDKQISLLWEENSGNVAWHITRLFYKKALIQPPRHILQEMLALCGAQSKEIIPVDLLNHPRDLRQALQEMAGYSLSYQQLKLQFIQAENQLQAAQKLDLEQRKIYERQYQQAETALNQSSAELNNFLAVYYQDFWKDSFQWLITENAEARELVEDVLDTVRVLRVASAVQQRGARLRTTGGHLIFLDRQTANVIYAINTGQKVFLLESRDTLRSGKVNLSATEFTHSGDLRISFYYGHFADETTTHQGAFNAAAAINELQKDMIGSFYRPPAGRENSTQEYAKKWKPVSILLENCDDNPYFAEQVKAQLILLNPDLKENICLTPSLQNSADLERNRYLNTEQTQWDLKTQTEILEKIAHSGHKIIHIQAEEAFQNVKSVSISAGETLMQAGSPASFVYVPLEEGLRGYPAGGYTPFNATPFVPLGNVGVIRGNTRNATLVAEKSVLALMIPHEVYLKHWHNTYDEQEFISILKSEIAG